MRCGLSLPWSALLLAAAVGCASLGREAPEVSLADARLDDVTIFETTGRITVRITNPAPDPVVVDGGTFHLWIDGRRVGRGVSDARVEVPRLGTETLEMQFFVSNLALARRVMSLIESESFDYRLEGRLFVWRSLGRRRVSFDHRGRFDREERRREGRELSPLDGGADGI